MSDDRFDELENDLRAVLRGQPPLRAPSTLEQRVREGIARRSARPWWERSFAEWPLLVRAAFVALSGCAACICIAGTLAVLNGPGAEMAARFLQQISLVRGAAQSLVNYGGGLLTKISSGWFYLGGGVLAAAYAGLFGLGAAAYRLLWKAR